jgi:hypothetical protein
LFQGGAVITGDQTPGTGVSFIQAGAGAVTRNMQDKVRESVSVLDFGAVGDGTTDDTAAIQAAINSGAKQVTGVAGQIYRITNTITINTVDFELDLNHAQLLLDDPSGIKNHLNVGDGVTQKNSNRIQNIAFTRAQSATAGYAIDCNLVGVTYISGCRIYGNNEIYNGIRILKGVQITIVDNYIDNCKNIAIYLEGTNSGLGKTNDVVVRDNRIEGGINQFVTWDFVEGVYCRGNIFYNPSSTAVSVNASSNANGLVSFKFESNDFDTCGGSGLYIDNVSNVQVCDCWFASNVADDIQIKTNTVACIISSNQFYPTASGIRVEGVDCRINTNIISGGTTCITLTNTANRTGICGNTLQNSQFGINLDVAQNTHFVGNLITAVTSGSVTGVGGSGTVLQSNVDGVVGTNAFVTVGASPFTYTAGRRPEYISIFGGTVSQIALGANAIAFASDRDVTLAPNQSVTVTYSSIPFMVKNIL